MRKLYQPLSGAKKRLIVFVLAVFSGTVYSQNIYTFSYTGSQQTITLAPGNYSIECWGANGGNATSSSTTTIGGKGGYATGVFSNSTTAVFNVYVGGRGNNASGSNIGAGGGGMSDVAPAANSTLIIIAAGGGGGAAAGSSSESSTGGDGGGLVGGTAIDGSGVSTGAAATGGSQTAGGSATAGSYGAGTPGGYGYGGGGANGGSAGAIHSAGGAGGNGGSGGWNGGGGGCTTTGGNDHAAGGGAGYYGGGGGRGDGGAGGGGSSYIGGVSSGTTVMFGQTGFVSNPVTTGDGLVRITELCSISLTAAGASNSVSPLICAGQSLTLTTDAVSNYSWSTGVTGTNQIVVSPTSNTIYAITATSNMSCTTTASLQVTVSSGVPALTISATSNSICLGDSVSITASGALSYTYSGGVSPGAYFTPSTTANYSVTGENGCGTSSSFITVTVSPLAVFALASPTTVCALKPTTLTAAGATSYTWFPNSIPSQTLIVAPASSMVYTVIGETGNCMGTTTVEVNTIPNPTISITASGSVICEGESVTMQLTGADSYTWQNTGLSGTSVTVTPNIPTAYNVAGTNSLGCTSSTQHIVIVNPQPTVSAAANPTLVCAGGTATLTASGANTYSWDTGASINTTTVSPSATAVYSVTGTETVNGCSSTQTVAVAVYIATIAVTQNTFICPGSSVVLSAGTAASYTWANGLGNTKQINVSPSSATIYTVDATINVGIQKCAASNTVQVDIHPQPTVTASSPRDAVCRNEKVVFTAGGAQNYQWNNGLTSPSFTLTALTTNPFNFTLTGIDANGCKDTDEITVTVGNCTGVNEQAMDAIKLYPNPNNGAFTLESEEQMHVTIYDFAGQLVREIKETKGLVRFEGLSKGVYVIHAQSADTRYVKSFIVE